MITFITIPEEKWKILKRRKDWIEQIENETGTKISATENQQIRIEGDDPLKTIRAKEIVRALGRGFDFQSALNLLDEDYFLEIIDLREYAKTKNRQTQLKARIIGTGGVVKKKIEEITGTKIAVYGKTVGLIGRWENIQKAKKAIEMILNGAMHNTVYRFLERQKYE